MDSLQDPLSTNIGSALLLILCLLCCGFCIA
jgi:hypothetical protein